MINHEFYLFFNFQYYNAAFGHDPEFLAQRAKICAEKHQRNNYEMYETPVGFWQIEFPPTQDMMLRNQKHGNMHKVMKQMDPKKKK